MMKRSILAAVIAALSLAACGDDKKPAEPAAKAEEAKASDSPAAKPAPDPWKTFSDDTYGFSVEAPRSPDVTEQPTPLADGRKLVSHNFMFSPPNPRGAMLVLVTPLDGDTYDFDAGQQTAIASMPGGKLASQKDLEVGGFRAREFRFTASPQGHAIEGHTLMVVRDDNIYQAMSVHAVGAARERDDGERFVASFALLPKKGR